MAYDPTNQESSDTHIPVGVDCSTSSGASCGQAACDLLGTACAAAIAAVAHLEVDATGLIPVLGAASIHLEGDFGVAAALTVVRIVLSGDVDMHASVVSVVQEEKVVKGDDRCQWYNPADWFGHCNPDETVQYHVNKHDTVACPHAYDVVTDPSRVGDLISDSCGASAQHPVVCMTAKADATAASNLGDAKAGPVEADNCGADDAARISAYFAAGFEQVLDTNEAQADGRYYAVPFGTLPEALQEKWKEQALLATEMLIEHTLADNYNGPPEGRSVLRDALEADAVDRVAGFDGVVLLNTAPQ